MKENFYDDPQFFTKYKNFPRSVQGLQAAGEWHVLQKLLPDFNGKRLLDLGCGFGWHCRYAAENGAAEVLGTDISQNMIEVAKSTTPQPNVQYKVEAMEDAQYADNHFDVVLSSLALHYIEDIVPLFQNIYRMLAHGGAFIFSAEHPIFTAHGTEEWYDAPNKARAHWPVDRYFEQGKRNANFLDCTVTKFHRPLSAYFLALLGAGFEIDGFYEPTPPTEWLDSETMRDELRRPMMMIFSAKKV